MPKQTGRNGVASLAAEAKKGARVRGHARPYKPLSRLLFEHTAEDTGSRKTPVQLLRQTPLGVRHTYSEGSVSP